MADNDTKVEAIDPADLEGEDGEGTPEIKEGEKDETDYKALAAKNAAIAKRNATKLAKLKEQLKVDKKVEQKLNDQKNPFDYGQKAFLKASGIAPSEYAFVQEALSATGKDLETILDSKYFQSELKELRDGIATKEATPTGQKRSTSSTRDTVEYWIAKGELPPADQKELRTKVVNAKIAKERAKNTFTDHPVV